MKITSDDEQQFVLGPGDYIGTKALKGTGGKEPSVQNLEALEDGFLYVIKKRIIDRVLGTNFFERETAKLTDAKKLREFQCMQQIDPDSLNVTTQIIAEAEFSSGDTILEQGDLVDPCLYLVREGEITLKTTDGKFQHTVKAGGYFGVEQMLVPGRRNDAEVKLPAEWNATVSGEGSCACGILSIFVHGSHESRNNSNRR